MSTQTVWQRPSTTYLQGHIMTDYYAIEAINAVLEVFIKGDINELGALNTISAITGANKITHNEAKEA